VRIFGEKYKNHLSVGGRPRTAVGFQRLRDPSPDSRDVTPAHY